MLLILRHSTLYCNTGACGFDLCNCKNFNSAIEEKERCNLNKRELYYSISY